MKAVRRVVHDVRPHWVGDGFPVRSLFSYHEDPASVSPFLLLDYAGPHEFAPAEAVRGVGEHPHRGFETVTIVYQGELEHRDSGGNSGKIGPGDVQWMTAASGVVHEEYHSPAFAKDGGTLEMVQLWVNLPAAEKMSPPRYQEIPGATIPTVEAGDGATLRVIAGEFGGAKGPAGTVTPIDVWDLRMQAGGKVELPVADGRTALLVVQKGSVRLNEAQTASGVELVTFERSGTGVMVEAVEDATVLVLSGEPIGEPVVGQGPFVMNSRDEIRQAMIDYQSGRMGSLAG